MIRRTQMNYGGGLVIDYDYLVTGEVTRIRENGATSGAGVLASYAYDDLGRRTSLTRGNGTAKSFGYDAASRLASISEDLAGTAGDLALAFTYNPASQIASSTRSNDVYAWTAHYNFNRSYTANGLNQYSASGSVSPTYDGRGNLTSAGATTYGYSSENMLTSASGGVALAYDPFLRLQQTSGGSAGTTKFGYDGQDLIAEYDGSNTVLRRYVHGPGSDEPLVWYEGTGTADRRWLHADERGSVIAVSNSAGATIATNAYDEYGIPRSSNTGRFQYTGQTWLPELGMYHYKARIYSPTLGRFLQTDPIGYGDGMNMYAYVGGDPVNKVDPSGLCGGGQAENDSGDCVDIVVTGKRVKATSQPLKYYALGGFDGSGGGEINGGADGEAGKTQDDCAYRDSSGRCVYVRDKNGKLQLDPDYAVRACRAYKAMKQSSREVAAVAGATNLPGAANATTGGSLSLLDRAAKFLSAPGFVFLRGVTYLTTAALAFGSSPPPGCE